MRIALLTIFNVPNYGSVLQTFATQKVLQNLGHECKIIRYNHLNNEYYKKLGKKHHIIKEFILNTLPLLKSGKLQNFRRRNLDFTTKFESFDELSHYNWDGFDLFIIGSDQVWNTRFLLGDPSFLFKFLPDEKPRISISSSFATNSIDPKYISQFAEGLDKFRAISVREAQGINIIHNDLHLNKDVALAADPTLLLNKQEWLSIIPKKRSTKKKPYILLYLLVYAFDPRPYIFDVVKYYHKKLGYEIKVLEGHHELETFDCPYTNVCRSGIPDFIDLFANADLVITSSFHGTAFAINFGIPLISIVPNTGDDRQSNLLKQVSAQQCIVTIGTTIEKINPNYNKREVAKKLESYRTETKNWILHNINA